MKTAILFGASGFIGSHLLEDLLRDEGYDHVIIVVRKKLDLNHPKLKQLTGDYHSLKDLKTELKGDHVFIALGTTRSQTPNQNDYYRIDHDYPILAASIAKDNGASSVFIVSSVGADTNSKAFYIRTKGEVERDLIKLDFQHTHIFRPSMLLGHRKAHRPLERVFIKIWQVVDPFMKGPLSHYHGIPGSDVARAMLHAAKNESAKVAIYHWPEMQTLLGAN
jgi:uncharacterized protein YbjT (DUF2867 family)